MIRKRISLRAFVIAMCISLAMQLGAPGLFYGVQEAWAASTVSISANGLMNGMFPGAPIKASSDPQGILRIGVTPSSISQTLTQATIVFSGTGFVTTTLANIATDGTSGVALYVDNGDGVFAAATDAVVTLGASPGWTGMLSAISLVPATPVALGAAGTEKIFYVVIKTRSTAVDGTQIIAAVNANGIVTTDGSGPATGFTSNHFSVDTVAPSIASIEGFTSSPSVSVRFSESVQKVGSPPAPLALADSPLTYVDVAGTAQTITGLSHIMGQHLVSLTMSGNLDAGDFGNGITTSTIAATLNAVSDMAGNVAGTTPVNFSSPLSITTSVVPATNVGQTYTTGAPLVTFAASGGAGSYFWTPADETSSSTIRSLGLDLISNGKVTGTVANVTGSFSFWVRARDASMASTTRQYTLNISPSGGGGVPGITFVHPGGGPTNSTNLYLRITGSNTGFSGSSVLDFLMPFSATGTNGVTIASSSSTSATTLGAMVNIAAGATPGARDVRVVTGGQTVLMPNGFTVYASGGSGLTQTLPSENATNVAIPPTFGFLQSAQSSVLSYRITVKTSTDPSNVLTPVWDYAFPKVAEYGGHCDATQCSVAYGSGQFRLMTPPASLNPNSDYYWQIRTYSVLPGSVADSVVPVETTAARKLTTTASVTDTTPPSMMHRPVFQATASANLNITARVMDNLATASTTPALSTKLFYCQGTSCNPTTEVTGSLLGAGYYRYSIPSADISTAGTITRYYLWASDSSNSSTFRNAGSTPFQFTSVAAGSATITGTVKDSAGDCTAAVRNTLVIAAGTGFSTSTNASCIFTLNGLFTGTYDLMAIKDGFGERSIDGIPSGSSNIAFRLSSGMGGGFGGDVTRPRVQANGPTDGMSNLPANDTNFRIFVAFNKAMNQTSLSTSGNLIVKEINQSTGTSTDITTSKGSWTYYPTAPTMAGVPSMANMAVWSFSGGNTFGNNKTISVAVTSTVTDTSGNPIQGNQSDGSYVFSFTTGGAFTGTFDGGTYGRGEFIPPHVTGSTPPPGTTNIPRNTRLVVNFSDPMADDAGAYLLKNNVKLFTVSGSTETDVSTSAIDTVSLDSTKRNATVTLLSTYNSRTFAASTRYRLKILGGARSASNMTIAPPGSDTQVMYTSEFTTGSTSDSTPPTVVGSFPDNSATNVPVNSSGISIAFSRDMDAGTINVNTVYLSIGSTVVNGTVSYQPLQRQAVIVPTSALNPSTTYTLNVTTGVTALNGATIETAVARTFTTGAADTGAPSIQFVNGDDHAIALTFSESMNAARVTDTLNWNRSVLNPAVYDVVKYGSAGFNTSTAGTTVNLSAARFSYDGMSNTVMIENVNLLSAVGQELYISVTSSASNAPRDLSGNTISTNYSRAPIRSSSNTNGALGPMAMGTSAFGGGGQFTPQNFSSSTFGFAPPVDVKPFNAMAGISTVYGVRIPISQQIPAAGMIVLTFPAGFDVSGAMQDVRSPMRTDLNGPGTGAVTFRCNSNGVASRSCAGGANTAEASADGGLSDDGVSVNGQIVTIFLSAATNSGGSDFLNIDLAGIRNTASPRDFNTTGYTVDVKTKNSSNTVLESLTSQPFFIQAGGSYTLSGSIKATGNTAPGTMRVYLASPMTGPMETTSANFDDTLSGLGDGAATATYSFSNLSAGDYMIFTDRIVTISGTQYAGTSMPEPIRLSGNATYNLTLSSATSGGTDVTIAVDGPVNEPIDIFASSPTGFRAIQQTLDGSAGLSENFTFNLGNGTWYVGVGPQMPTGPMSGPPPAPSYMPPRPKEIKINGASCMVEGVPGCSISYTLTSSSKTIKGLVKDVNDRIMANAEVFAFSPQSGFGTHAQSDTSGAFSLGVNDGTYVVGAFVPGMPPSKELSVTVSGSGAYLFINGATTGITPEAALAGGFVLKVAKPDYTISGIVTDGTNVAQGASVYGYRTDGPGHVNANTDSSGQYTLYVSNGSWRVGVFLPQYGNLTEQSITINGASASNKNFAPADTGTFYTVSGRVYVDTNGSTDYTTGEGISGAFVRIRGTGRVNEAISASDGTYSFRVPSGTGYILNASVPNVGELPPLAAFDVSGNVSNKDFQYATPNTITFVYSTSVADGFIEAFSTTGQGGHAGVRNGTSTTMLLPNGSYQLKFFAPGVDLAPSDASGTTMGTAYNQTTGILTINGDESITITLPTLRSVAGTVTSGGVAIADAWVEIMRPGTPIRTGTRSAANGTFTLWVPDSAATYSLNAMKPGYFREPNTITVNGSNTSSVGLVMSSASMMISGQVRIGSSGAANAFVRAEKQGGGFTGTQADASGNFSLSVTDGTWRIYAIAQGYAETAYASNPITVSGVSLTGKNITLSSTVALDPPMTRGITPSSGGSMADQTTGMRIVFPANALGTDTNSANVSMSETNNLRRTGTAHPLGTGMELTAEDSDGNRISSFTNSVTIERAYTVAELAASPSASDSSIDTATEVNDMSMAYWDETTQNWVAVPTTIAFLDSNGNIIASPSEDLSNVTKVRFTANTTHFSLYAPVSQTNPNAPLTPSGLAASASSRTAIALSWTAVGGSTGYDIYRSTTAGGTYSRLGSEPTVSSGSTVSYSDTGLTAGTTYFYQITALNASGESGASAAVSATTQAAATDTGSGGVGSGSGIYSSSPPAVSTVVSTPTPTVTVTAPTVTVTTPAPVTVAPTPAAPVTLSPVLTPAPVVVAPVPAPVIPSVVTFVRAPATIVVTTGNKLAFAYAYKNTGKKTQKVSITRELFAANGKRLSRSVGSASLKANQSWKKTVKETLPKKATPGKYKIVITITDAKTKKVIGSSTQNMEVKAKSKPVAKPKTVAKPKPKAKAKK